MNEVKMPPTIGAAIRFITSAPVPVDHMIGTRPKNRDSRDDSNGTRTKSSGRPTGAVDGRFNNTLSSPAYVTRS
jgi:hypothetical protein